MPTYEYECPEGHEFELFQRMSDEPRASCPECGREAKRVLSGGGGILFKGEGFYATDYRSEEYREKASSEKKQGSGDEGTSSAEGQGSVANGESSTAGADGSGRSGTSTGE